MPTDQGAIDAHRNTVRSFSTPGGPLSPASLNATVNNPQWFSRIGGSLRPRGVRRELHRSIIQEHLAKYPDARQDRHAIVLAGPPGAGKSFTLEKLLGEREAEYVTIDADDFKQALLNAALNDGSYEQYLVPEAVRDLRQTGEQFFPLELASLVHEESSMLAKRMRSTAITDGYNVVIDTVLSSESGALDLGSQLQDAGYSIEVIDVEVPFALSVQRIAQRWQKSYEEALEQKPGERKLGGRWVPSEYAWDVFNGPDGRSRPEVAAQRLAHECTAVKEFRRYRTTLDEKGQAVGPVLEVNQHRATHTAPLTKAAKSVDAKAAAARDFAQDQVGPLRAKTQQSVIPRRPLPGPSRPSPRQGPGQAI